MPKEDMHISEAVRMVEQAAKAMINVEPVQLSRDLGHAMRVVLTYYQAMEHAYLGIVRQVDASHDKFQREVASYTRTEEHDV